MPTARELLEQADALMRRNRIGCRARRRASPDDAGCRIPPTLSPTSGRRARRRAPIQREPIAPSVARTSLPVDPTESPVLRRRSCRRPAARLARIRTQPMSPAAVDARPSSAADDAVDEAEAATLRPLRRRRRRRAGADRCRRGDRRRHRRRGGARRAVVLGAHGARRDERARTRARFDRRRSAARRRRDARRPAVAAGRAATRSASTSRRRVRADRTTTDRREQLTAGDRAEQRTPAAARADRARCTPGHVDERGFAHARRCATSRSLRSRRSSPTARRRCEEEAVARAKDRRPNRGRRRTIGGRTVAPSLRGAESLAGREPVGGANRRSNPATSSDASAAAPVSELEQQRIREIAEEIGMQVLQRIDIFTDTTLRAQLGERLRPVVDRAAADLVAAINEHVGELLRAQISEAIEREIESWRARPMKKASVGFAMKKASATHSFHRTEGVRRCTFCHRGVIAGGAPRGGPSSAPRGTGTTTGVVRRRGSTWLSPTKALGRATANRLC